MTSFQQTALLLTLIWFVVVILWFQRSSLVLIGGLLGIGLYTAAALMYHLVALEELGLRAPISWLFMLELVLVWLVLMLAYSPLADRLASRVFEKPPTLEAFGAIQESTIKFMVGILTAWALGGILEELIARGIVLQSLEALLKPWIGGPLATGTAIVIAAIGAGIMHSYQGPRAIAIITQLSILFGILFVVSGYNLWSVIACHGLYDTIAFVRFARRKSRYSNPGSAWRRTNAK